MRPHEKQYREDQERNSEDRFHTLPPPNLPPKRSYSGFQVPYPPRLPSMAESNIRGLGIQSDTDPSDLEASRPWTRRRSDALPEPKGHHRASDNIIHPEEEEEEDFRQSRLSSVRRRTSYAEQHQDSNVSSSSSSATHSPTLPLPMSRTMSGPSLPLPRLPSLSNIRRDLPDSKHFSTDPAQHTSPEINRSPSHSRGGSRGSVSSRGSSPRPPSSASSASSRRRSGFGFTSAIDTSALKTSPEPPTFNYELVIRQQPGKAAAAGLSPPALSRLPIVPSPIVQLRVTDQDGKIVPHRHVVQNLPYLVCSCTLLRGAESSRGESPVDYAEVDPPSSKGPQALRRNPLAMLCGTRVYSAIEAADLDGQMGLFFVFWDASIRQEGSYRMKFSLIEALPGSPTLATVVTQSFDTVSFAEFPGEVSIATELSRHFARQGLNVYLPPLGVSTGI